MCLGAIERDLIPMVFEIKGFHTCRAEGSKDELLNKVPFLSKKKGQWLGQGYYFWTELDVWAKDWLGDADKVISRFHLTVPRDELLDLVGSLSDQAEFLSIIDRFKQGSLGRLYRSKFSESFNVSDLVSWLREEKNLGFDEIFPYWAVRAKDNVSKRRALFRAKHGEELFLLERHQMCVYAEHKGSVVRFEKFTYPQHFTDDINIGALA